MAIYEPKVYAGLNEDQICEHVSRHGHNAHKVVEQPQTGLYDPLARSPLWFSFH